MFKNAQMQRLGSGRIISSFLKYNNLKRFLVSILIVVMHKMSKDEKLEHRRKKKELKEKITEEDKKRI